jgi:hypothetical protein
VVTITAYGGVELQMHTSLTSKLDIHALDDMLPWRMPIMLTEQGGWFGATSGLDGHEKRKYLPRWDSNSYSSGIHQ